LNLVQKRVRLKNQNQKNLHKSTLAFKVGGGGSGGERV
jgi:hypothetical protein